MSGLARIKGVIAETKTCLKKIRKGKTIVLKLQVRASPPLPLLCWPAFFGNQDPPSENIMLISTVGRIGRRVNLFQGNVVFCRTMSRHVV